MDLSTFFLYSSFPRYNVWAYVLERLITPLDTRRDTPNST